MQKKDLNQKGSLLWKTYWCLGNKAYISCVCSIHYLLTYLGPLLALLKLLHCSYYNLCLHVQSPLDKRSGNWRILKQMVCGRKTMRHTLNINVDIYWQLNWVWNTCEKNRNDRSMQTIKRNICLFHSSIELARQLLSINGPRNIWRYNDDVTLEKTWET